MTRHLLAAALLFQVAGGRGVSSLPGMGPAIDGAAARRHPAGGAGGSDRRRGPLPRDPGHQGGAAGGRHGRGRVPPLRSRSRSTRRRRTQDRCCSCVTTRCRRGSSSVRSTPLGRTGCVRSRRESGSAEHEPGGVARPRRACRSPSPRPGAPGGRPRIRRTRGRPVCRACGRRSRSSIAAALRQWLADPQLAARAPLCLLLLGISGNAQDAAAIEQRLEAAWESGDTANRARCWPPTWSCAARSAWRG